MDRKLLASALLALVLGLVIGKNLGAESAREAANKEKEAAKLAAFSDGRASGCTTLVRLMTPFGNDIKCAVEADNALYVEGPMVRGGKENLDEGAAQ